MRSSIAAATAAAVHITRSAVDYENVYGALWAAAVDTVRMTYRT